MTKFEISSEYWKTQSFNMNFKKLHSIKNSSYSFSSKTKLGYRSVLKDASSQSFISLERKSDFWISGEN